MNVVLPDVIGAISLTTVIHTVLVSSAIYSFPKVTDIFMMVM